MKYKEINMMKSLYLKMNKLITINSWMKLLIRNVKSIALHMNRNKLKEEEFLKRKMKNIMVHKTMVMMMNSQKKISL
jgi:hypothetical protein